MIFLGIFLGIGISIIACNIVNHMLRKKGKQFGLVDYKKWKNE